MKYLIAGLGNIGEQYENTRHNIGFTILEALIKAPAYKEQGAFSVKRYADVASYKYKGRTFILIKPVTYVNMSGKAINYWLQKEKINIENLLVVVDDIALPFGTLRMREKGRDGGHNGLKSIIEVLGTDKFARLRFGIGSEFFRGQQVDYVLNEFSEEEKKILPERIQHAIEMLKSFGTIGVHKTMSLFNNR